jgi:hypothetical protein
MFKCNDLFRRQLPVTKEQLEPVLFDAPTSIQRTTWSWEEVGGTICSWTLDKLKHTKLSLVCLGFTSMNVPLCLNVQVRVHLGNIQMTGVAFGGHVSWVLCSVYLDSEAVGRNRCQQLHRGPILGVSWSPKLNYNAGVVRHRHRGTFIDVNPKHTRLNFYALVCPRSKNK